MPRACEPGLKFDLWLEFDADKPEAVRPVFVCRTLSMSEKMKIGRVLDLLGESKDSDDLYNRLVDGLAGCFSGWRNMTDRDGNPVEFGPDGLRQVLTLYEGIELIRKALNAQVLSADDKKKPESSE
jgi:hypothetical protein